MQDQTVLGFLSARRYEVQALILVHSLHQFGAKLSDIPVCISVPEGQEMQGPVLDALQEFEVEIIPFAFDEALRKFPFVSKAVASALAEGRAEAEGVQLVWHDRTGMVANEPKGFILPPGKSIGFRPADIANIGAPYGQPLPNFWEKR